MATLAPMKIAVPCVEETFDVSTSELTKANEQLAVENLRLQRSNELLRIKAELVAENERLKMEAGGALDMAFADPSMVDAQAYYGEECGSTNYGGNCGYGADCAYGAWQMDTNCGYLANCGYSTDDGYGAGVANGYRDMDLESTVAGSVRDRSFSSFSTATNDLFSFSTELMTSSEEVSAKDDDTEVIELLEDDEQEVLLAPPGLGGVETKTTMMMRNFPNSLQRSTLEKLLNAQGFEVSYNLVYVPMDFTSTASFGYAFINFVSTSEALRFQAHFHGFTAWECESQKVCDVAWSDGKQGFQAHVERYRNSPVMHESVPDHYKPAVYCNGVRLLFAHPTKAIKAPRFRKRD